jgi:hypothetical protein
VPKPVVPKPVAVAPKRVVAVDLRCIGWVYTGHLRRRLVRLLGSRRCKIGCTLSHGKSWHYHTTSRCIHFPVLERSIRSVVEGVVAAVEVGLRCTGWVYNCHRNTRLAMLVDSHDNSTACTLTHWVS